MFKMRLSFLALPLLFLCGLHSHAIVSTSYGRVQGSEESGSISFKGVPFAKPPVGDLRWQLPQYPEPWSGVLETMQYKPACMSNSSTTSTPQKLISEDCLYVNVFTSQECLKSKCPVIVYFHGGAFNLDSATMFPDAFIKERYVNQGIVFAIPAFRLGVFGNMYFGKNNVLSENLLMFDAVQALNFIHDEIDNFGGDPEQVTIMGHSSGGTMVDVLSFSTMVDPDLRLFQQQIVLSAPGMFGDEKMVIETSYKFARRVGCMEGYSDLEIPNAAEILNCMRKIDGFDLIRMQREAEDQDKLHFTCIIRGAPFMHSRERIENMKKNAPVRRMVVGVTEHEFRTQTRYTAPYLPGGFMDIHNTVFIAEKYYKDYENGTRNMTNSDSAAVFVSAATYAEGLANAGGDVYLFETRQKPYSFHVSDMQYFIGIHREGIHTPDMDILDSFYSQMLVNFTKYGKPYPTWEKYNPVEDNFLALEIDTENGIGPRMKYGFHQEEREYWLKNITFADAQHTVDEFNNIVDNAPSEPKERVLWRKTRMLPVPVVEFSKPEEPKEPKPETVPRPPSSITFPFWFVPQEREERNLIVEIIEVVIGFAMFIAFLGAINMVVETVKQSCREDRERMRQERTPVLNHKPQDV